jgi:hypothetical protein
VASAEEAEGMTSPGAEQSRLLFSLLYHSHLSCIPFTSQFFPPHSSPSPRLPSFLSHLLPVRTCPG